MRPDSGDGKEVGGSSFAAAPPTERWFWFSGYYMATNKSIQPHDDDEDDENDNDVGPLGSHTRFLRGDRPDNCPVRSGFFVLCVCVVLL